MGTIIRSQAWFASWDGTMTTQEDWRLRNVIRSVIFISGDSSFPCYIGVSHRYNNLRRKEIKEESTKPTTSVREFTSNNVSIEARVAVSFLSLSLVVLNSFLNPLIYSSLKSKKLKRKVMDRRMLWEYLKEDRNRERIRYWKNNKIQTWTFMTRCSDDMKITSNKLITTEWLGQVCCTASP